jgi:ferredoxin
LDQSNPEPFNEEEEKAEVILPKGGPEDCIEEAMETCPTECIH